MESSIYFYCIIERHPDWLWDCFLYISKQKLCFHQDLCFIYFNSHSINFRIFIILLFHGFFMFLCLNSFIYPCATFFFLFFSLVTTTELYYYKDLRVKLSKRMAFRFCMCFDSTAWDKRSTMSHVSNIWRRRALWEQV